MYNQFFGNYLFSKGYVTKEQLIPALMRQSKESVRVQTLALYAGYMSADEIELVIEMQKDTGSKFIDLAIEQGYLTQDQVLELMDAEAPSFLFLGQVFIDDGVFTYSEFHNILTDYRSQNEFLELELNSNNKDEIQCLIDNFAILSETTFSPFGKSYLELLFNNFIRFIGDDFSPLPPDVCTEFTADHCIKQSIAGNYEINTYLSMDASTALLFAGRYAGERFVEYNEYVQACLEDFINLHNGLFIVNASNDKANELTIGTIDSYQDTLMSFANKTYHFPVYYPFGFVHYLIEIIRITEPN